jgi:hypothetical protein
MSDKKDCFVMETPEIKLLKGFCSVLFGNTPSQIKAHFGNPNEIETLQDEILDTACDVYHYWDLGFSLFFDKHKNNVFTSVEVDNEKTILFQNHVFHLNEKEFIELMKSNGFVLSETEQHDWGERRVSFDEAGLDCYFEKGKLVSINFGVLPDDAGIYHHAN